MDRVSWGILGTGDIARQFASDLKLLDEAELYAVASRTQARADEFGDTHEIPKRYPSYEALVADPAVDVVYIATPHIRHCQDTLLALEAGKAVLCEKPFALNALEATSMIEAARGKDLFLMEAMWMHFFPAMAKLREILDEGALGDIRFLRADFCFRIDFDPEFRLFNPKLGGGALLDVGVYPMALAQAVLGVPESIRSTAELCETGVDEHAGILLGYEHGAFAMLTCASTIEMPQTALIVGELGHVHIPQFSQPDSLTLISENIEEEFNYERMGYGYAFEAIEVMRCLREGRRESWTFPLHDSLSLMESLDAIRSQWGLAYPGEAIVAAGQCLPEN